MLLILAVSRVAAQPLPDRRVVDDARDIVDSDAIHGDDDRDSAVTRHARDGSRDVPVWRRHLRPCDCERDAIVRIFAQAPALTEVVAAARRAAGLARDPIPSWRRRSRLAALVPRTSLRAGNSASWREVLDPTISHAASWGASLSWRLDRLIYDPNEARFAGYDQRRRRERRRVDQLASRAYFAWIEAAAAATEHDGASLLELHRAQAELDALTDGWFSQAASNSFESR